MKLSPGTMSQRGLITMGQTKGFRLCPGGDEELRKDCENGNDVTQLGLTLKVQRIDWKTWRQGRGPTGTY